ncbi:putative LRR receptor-like serine/threonine-protein kinase At1g07550 [Apium graveolens]|uniref:putative LRR receptor-like serine/threonine-protein kinase At1g07550 n=1 Tax=Apium graveolens TaxID=4045 RepID=UPI003D7B45B3
MNTALWIFFAFFALQLLSSSSEDADTTNWNAIDCGNDEISFGDNLFVWDVDADYTKSGSNELVRTKTSRGEFNTLRAFPGKSKHNCYNVPIETQRIRYIISLGFYYGNYDGLFKPPAFDLFINNKKWTTVNTSKNDGEPFYEEIIYQNKGSVFFKICLVQIKDGGVPIINSIEMMNIYDELYPKMDTNATYNLVTRINLGGSEVRYGSFNDEIYNRIWSEGVTPYASVSGFSDFDPTPENHPPIPVMDDGIEFNASSPITLITDLPQLSPQSAYIVLYISNLLSPYDANKTVTIKIEINNEDQGKVEMSSYYGKTTVVTKYPVMVSGPTINITVSPDWLPSDDSSFPPTIAAMEVFTKWDSDKSAAARQYFSFACPMMMILFMLFFGA